MNALLVNPYTQLWAGIGATMSRRKAILSVSAHWYIEDVAVTVPQKASFKAGGYHIDKYSDWSQRVANYRTLFLTCVARMFPWFNSLMDRDREVLGQDWWPYGIDANRKAIEAILRYHYEQGITPKRFTMEEIFAPELLNT